MSDSEKQAFNSLRNSNSELFRGSLYALPVQQKEIELVDMELPIGTPGARAMRSKIRAARLARDSKSGVLPDATRISRKRSVKPATEKTGVKKTRPTRISEHERNQREDKLRVFRSKMKNTSVMKKDAEKQ